MILLSLVRSSNTKGIGFLDNRNRLVVALSRARRGLYIFGNAVTLTLGETKTDEGVEVVGRDPLWDPLVLYLASKGRLCFDWGLPITCKNHEKTIFIEEAQQWFGRAGGCDEPCAYGLMKCGHPCTLKCHPYDHTQACCPVACVRVLSCGHDCSKYCGEVCFCEKCMLHDGEFARLEESSGGIVDIRLEDPEWFDRDEPSSSSLTKRNLRNQIHDERHATSHQSGNLADRRPFSTLLFGGGNLSDSQNRTTGPELQGNFISMLDKTQVQAWNNWDAQQEDEKLAEKRRQEQVARPQVDASTLEFTEIHKNVEIKNGVRRQLSGATRRVIGRKGNMDSSNSSPGQMYTELFGAQQAQPLQTAEWPALKTRPATQENEVCSKPNIAPDFSYARVSSASHAQVPVSAFKNLRVDDHPSSRHRVVNGVGGFDCSSDVLSKTHEELLREKKTHAVQFKQSEKTTMWPKLETKLLHVSASASFQTEPRQISNADEDGQHLKLSMQAKPGIWQSLEYSTAAIHHNGVPDIWRSNAKPKVEKVQDNGAKPSPLIASKTPTLAARYAAVAPSIDLISSMLSTTGEDLAIPQSIGNLEHLVTLPVEKRPKKSTVDKPKPLIDVGEVKEIVNAKNASSFFDDDLIAL